MNGNLSSQQFENVSQRVAATYRRMLAAFCPALPGGIDPAQTVEMQSAQADLHAFFQAMYDALYSDPALFGLPLTEDRFLIAEHAKEGPTKEEMNRLLSKPRKLISEAVDFLSHMGLFGQLESQALALDAGSPQPGFPGKKAGRAFLAGMERAGLHLEARDGGLRMTSTLFPRMMPALQALAQACAACDDADRGRLFFTRCDFRALQGDYRLDALDLFRVFSPEEQARAEALHAFFTGRSYQAQIEASAKLGWIVKYQGDKAVKSTPLFQIWFDDRLRSQIQAGVKCASAPRIIGLLPDQSPALQDDFSRRVNPCYDCGWCQNKKAHQPVEYTYQGQTRKICWYVNYDILEFSDETIPLVQEYTRMHERLG